MQVHPQQTVPKYSHTQVCLPGLHITLGVFFRLFTLLEDECHNLDLQMAASSSTQEGDRPGFVAFTEVIKKERALLDEKALVENELKWLGQILSHLVINSAIPSTDPQVVGINKLAAERKKRWHELVSA